MSLRPDSGRQSPFKRQNSTAGTPTNTSPTKPSPLSTSRPNSLSPEKASPFARRPSQIGQQADRPSSPFARPSSSLSVSATPDEDDHRAIPSPSPFDGAPGDSATANLSPLRPRSERERAGSTTSTVKPLNIRSAAPPKALNATPAGGSYTHIPQPLLRSMRESFEVLDSSNSGSINSAAVGAMLEQMGLPNAPGDLRGFFPGSAGQQNLNLARYLDLLSSSFPGQAQTDELRAAFEAFDVDDSGQIDLAELRKAVLGPVEGGERLGESDVDDILAEFAGRRAFGKTGGMTERGEVFRWREFMGSYTGGSMGMSNAGESEGVVA